MTHCAYREILHVGSGDGEGFDAKRPLHFIKWMDDQIVGPAFISTLNVYTHSASTLTVSVVCLQSHAELAYGLIHFTHAQHTHN